MLENMLLYVFLYHLGHIMKPFLKLTSDGLQFSSWKYSEFLCFSVPHHSQLVSPWLTLRTQQKSNHISGVEAQPFYIDNESIQKWSYDLVVSRTQQWIMIFPHFNHNISLKKNLTYQKTTEHKMIKPLWKANWIYNYWFGFVPYTYLIKLRNGIYDLCTRDVFSSNFGGFQCLPYLFYRQLRTGKKIRCLQTRTTTASGVIELHVQHVMTLYLL